MGSWSDASDINWDLTEARAYVQTEPVRGRILCPEGMDRRQLIAEIEDSIANDETRGTYEVEVEQVVDRESSRFYVRILKFVSGYENPTNSNLLKREPVFHAVRVTPKPAEMGFDGGPRRG
jgi:hypothetical protein